MSEHETLQAEIPAYVGSRLEGKDLERLERHLEECGICSDMVETWKSIVAGMRDAGEDLFSPHPDPLTLREFALGGPEGKPKAVARHLTSCPSCSLEMAFWASQEGGAGPARETSRLDQDRRRRLILRRPAWALAAGIVLGAGLALLAVKNYPRASRPAGLTAPSITAEGLAPLWVLPGPFRGQVPVAQFPLPATQSQVLIAVRPILSAAAADDRFRWEIRRQGGPAIWTTETAGGVIRSYVETSEVVTLAVPAQHLTPGSYDLVLSSIAGRQPELLMQIPFRVTP